MVGEDIDVEPTQALDLQLDDHEVIEPDMDSATISSEIAADRIDTYVDAVTAHVAGFYHLEGKLFAVQGWDVEKGHSVDNWYHLEYKVLMGDVDPILVACTCPSGLDSTCIHAQFFVKYDVESLLEFGGNQNSEPSLAIMFLQNAVQNDNVASYFSVLSASSSALKGRAFVKHVGAPGSWIVGDGEGDGVMGSHNGRAAGSPVNELVGSRCGQVSHLPINVPTWASLPSDPLHYPTPPPFRSPPDHPFLLDSQSSCPCPEGRTFYDEGRPSELRQCKIYTLCGVLVHLIQLQPCPRCPPSRRRFIGPDLREKGLFNFNNTILVSHELLDEYTSAYTSSETPFSSWVLHLSRRYRATGDSFMGEDLFRTVWFSYVSLQGFSSDMKCSRCGDYPETVIWDGITLAFGRKHLTSTLKPPTKVSDSSLVRRNVRYNPRQQLILDAALRKQVRLAVDPPSLDALTELEEEGAITSSPSKGRSRELKAIGEHLNRVNTVKESLEEICPALGALFEESFGESTYAQRRKTPAAYKSFFIQIAAEESVLQLINNSSLNALRSFMANPTKETATQILGIPALYKLVQVHEDITSLVPIMSWLMERASTVLSMLKVEDPLPDVQDAVGDHGADGDWKQG
ncbi:hypothetical protein CC1G_06055 [Coprinopsis cinerea okayama7|uniref:HMG domain-containing protein n=1 Tax=Coprinopsis cinerea (strain Okayama-7 / 130 / ATCC MYA-4618 / FGSC 9003) TaxID=240176 RepID=A8N4H8_COPC7|nr:hypothetical protein CC1G_06055 [Coprinopsis cinerea okayama7\|eukprot:XP_001829846.2 hypothetical protein CC1G_06055 [Coprinopsis cinerea okayama7\